MSEMPAPANPVVRPRALTTALGCTQVLSWGVTFYLPAVIAEPAASSLGVPRIAVVGAFSLALLVAGLTEPRIVGRIDRVGGRPVLTASVVVIAVGLVVLATAPGPVLWYIGWVVLGLGMAGGLYDGAFATVGCLLGPQSASIITGITLFGGFASSVFWPLGTYLAGVIGWRTLLLCYAALELGVNLPLVLLFVPPRGAVGGGGAAAASAPGDGGTLPMGRAKTLVCLSSFFTIRWLITSAIAVYILLLLGGVGLTRGHAVLVAALIGPGQVFGRLVDWTLARRIAVLTRARLGACLLPIGIAVLLVYPEAAIAFAILYGMSNGILTVNRGTLPMALFGRAGYARLLGWLAVPVMLAQAAAPTVAAPLIAALPPHSVFLLAGALGAGAGFLLLALRLPRG